MTLVCCPGCWAGYTALKNLMMQRENMDPVDRTNLDTRIGRLLLVRDTAVVDLARKAQDAMGTRKWDEAEKLVNKAEKAYAPAKKLGTILVDEGAIPSMAQARRAVQGGQVKVDGVQTRKFDVLIQPGQKVELKGRGILQGG